MKRGVSGAISSLAGILLAGALLTGCLGESDPEPKRISGAPKEVADVVARLERVTRRGQFAELCDDLFTRSARSRAGGNDCVELLRATAKDVRDARIRLLEVKIQGTRARARVRTVAEGQAAVEETIDLVRERGRFRIAALRG
ncbi:MAG: hypothetical protein H0U24_04905 [Thermoleophilaceae bacterium]|nr:hypothetical protein [Thermoleophilaceae bacterium]